MFKYTVYQCTLGWPHEKQLVAFQKKNVQYKNYKCDVLNASNQKETDAGKESEEHDVVTLDSINELLNYGALNGAAQWSVKWVEHNGISGSQVQFPQRQNTKWFFSICSTLGELSYLVLVGER